MKSAATRQVWDGKICEITSQVLTNITSHLIERMMMETIESFTIRYMRIYEDEYFPSREAFNEFRRNVLFMNHETSKEDDANTRERWEIQRKSFCRKVSCLTSIINRIRTQLNNVNDCQWVKIFIVHFLLTDLKWFSWCSKLCEFRLFLKEVKPTKYWKYLF